MRAVAEDAEYRSDVARLGQTIATFAAEQS